MEHAKIARGLIRGWNLEPDALASRMHALSSSSTLEAMHFGIILSDVGSEPCMCSQGPTSGHLPPPWSAIKRVVIFSLLSSLRQPMTKQQVTLNLRDYFEKVPQSIERSEILVRHGELRLRIRGSGLFGLQVRCYGEQAWYRVSLRYSISSFGKESISEAQKLFRRGRGYRFKLIRLQESNDNSSGLMVSGRCGWRKTRARTCQRPSLMSIASRVTAGRKILLFDNSGLARIKQEMGGTAGRLGIMLRLTHWTLSTNHDFEAQQH